MNILPAEFDDIRPYYDSEIPKAMRRIAEDPFLGTVINYLGMDDKTGYIKELLYSLQSIDDFQTKVMYPLFKTVKERTIRLFTYDGIENIDSKKGCLFISNHRDIVLDAILLQDILYENGIPTSQITFGENLMHPQFVVDIGMSNKMFKTVRKNYDMKSYLRVAKHLYSYINYVVTHGESVWIAQRNGRTKNGIDRTEPGLIRMLVNASNDINTLETLRITPVSVSYQWEPCGILKAVELYKSGDGNKYIKSSGEDLNSIITGITSNKGDTHISIGKPIDGSRYCKRLKKEDCMSIASELDQAICSGYRLWDTNFVACDLLNRQDKFKDRYSKELKEEYLEVMNHSLEKFPELDRDTLMILFLKIYAGPVDNCNVNKS